LTNDGEPDGHLHVFEQSIRGIDDLPQGRPRLVKHSFHKQNDVETIRKNVSQIMPIMSADDRQWWESTLDILSKGDYHLKDLPYCSVNDFTYLFDLTPFKYPVITVEECDIPAINRSIRKELTFKPVTTSQAQSRSAKELPVVFKGGVSFKLQDKVKQDLIDEENKKLEQIKEKKEMKKKERQERKKNALILAGKKSK